MWVGHTFLMRWAAVFVFVVSGTGCFTDISGNAADDDDDAGASTSGGDEDESTSTTDEDDTGRPDPTSDSDPAGSTSGPGTITTGSTGDGTTTESDTDVEDPTGGPPSADWPPQCVFDPGPLPQCDNSPLSGEKAGGDQCELTGFTNDSEDLCGLPEFAETSLQGPAEEYVIGVLGAFGAVSVVGQNAEDAPLDCAQAWGPFVSTAADSGGLAVRVRVNAVDLADVVVRPAGSLCEVGPEGADCCTGAGATPASAACGNEGLRDCVVGFDPYCNDTAWDDVCVATAVLRCGANCVEPPP